MRRNNRSSFSRRPRARFDPRWFGAIPTLIAVLALPGWASSGPAGGGCLEHGTPAGPERGGAAAYGVYGDARLARLIDAALANNPALREARALYRAERQRIPQVTALPDPVLQVTQFARSPETRVGPQTTLLSVTQSFPGFGKRRLRGESTARAAAVRVEELQARRAEVVHRVKASYYDLAYVDRALEVNREEAELLAHYETLARARYVQGFGRQGDVLRLQAEITRSMSVREELHWRRADAAAALNAALDRAPDAPVAAVALADRPAVRMDEAALAAAGRSARPDVLASRRRLERREADVRLAQRSHWPDFSVGVAWGNVLRRRDPAGRAMPPTADGKDVYSVMLGVNLPLFRAKYDAGVREAAERAEAARAAHHTTVNETRRAIRAAAFRLRAIERQIELFDRTLLPQAEQALISTEAAYSTGGADVLDLLDGGRLLLDVRLGLSRLHADYFVALADVERAAGSPVPEEAPR